MANEPRVSLMLDLFREDRCRELFLIDCGLRRLPELKESEWSKIKFMDLSSNELSELPNSLCRSTNLRQASLEQNRFKEVPACLRGLGLRYLNLADNLIQEIPEGEYLSSLEELYAAGNLITDLTPHIASARKLAFLDLSRNRLASLPTEIGELRRLEVLILHGNPLESLPEEICQLDRLKQLVLPDSFRGASEDALTQAAEFKPALFLREYFGYERKRRPPQDDGSSDVRNAGSSHGD